MPVPDIYYLVLVVIGSALFSGIELAFITANKISLEIQKQKGSMTSKALTVFYNNPTQFLGTLLIGNTVMLVIYSTLFEAMLHQPLPDIITQSKALTIAIVTFISTVVILIFGEFVPKNIFRINPNAFLNIFAFPVWIVYILLFPFVRFSVWLAENIIKLVWGIDYQKVPQPTLSLIDLQHYVHSNKQNPDEDYKVDTLLFQRALELPSVKARACMVPRLEIAAINKDSQIEEVRKLFIETKHSKIIAYQNSIDDVVGYIHHQDILKNTYKIWPIITVPEAMPATNLLNLFIKENKSIALVKDEFGGTAGIITLEDIMEEIFGEIHDEFDNDDFVEAFLEDADEYLLSARLEIDYLNDKYGFKIPPGDYETLSGYIIARNEDIPDEGEVLYIDEFRFTISEVSNTTVKTVRMKLIEE
ncbi:MAG: HlyC/CorC family transporter [Sphingobacteriales bacterium]|nr:MAG: HlyC/CorC family transporter [Sphingobacteriales bacterium]